MERPLLCTSVERFWSASVNTDHDFIDLPLVFLNLLLPNIKLKRFNTAVQKLKEINTFILQQMLIKLIKSDNKMVLMLQMISIPIKIFIIGVFLF